jgi:hypothetical protein
MILDTINNGIKKITNNAILDTIFGSPLWSGLIISFVIAIIALFIFKDSTADNKTVCMNALKVFLYGSIASVGIGYISSSKLTTVKEKEHANTKTDEIHKDVLMFNRKTGVGENIIGGLEDAFIPVIPSK